MFAISRLGKLSFDKILNVLSVLFSKIPEDNYFFLLRDESNIQAQSWLITATFKTPFYKVSCD